MWILVGASAVLGLAFVIIGTVTGNQAAVIGDTTGLRRAKLTKFLGMILVLVGAALVVTQFVLQGV